MSIGHLQTITEFDVEFVLTDTTFTLGILHLHVYVHVRVYVHEHAMHVATTYPCMICHCTHDTYDTPTHHM